MSLFDFFSGVVGVIYAGWLLGDVTGIILNQLDHIKKYGWYGGGNNARFWEEVESRQRAQEDVPTATEGGEIRRTLREGDDDTDG